MLADVAVRASSPVLVGRSGQLAALDAALAAARDGSPSAVLVGGEAGVGKSRLVTEFAEHSRGTGAQVLTGGCLELGTDGLPFAPFTAVLRELVRERGADGIAGLLPGHATRELARLLPEFGEPATAADAGEARARLFEQVLTLLEQLADEAPVVLVIEDAHWADRSTRDLLAFLIRNQGALDGLLIVVTYRSDELHRTHPLRPLLAELDRISWVTRIELGRLSRADTGELAARLLGREPGADLLETVYRRTEGNPLFVEALLDGDRLGPGLPESLRDLLVAGVRRLPEETQEVVRVASAGGERIGHALLATVTGLDSAGLTRALRPAVAANVLLTDPDGFAFRHALIRESMQQELLPGEGGRLHCRFAEAIGSDPALVPPGRAAAEQAHHWYAAHDLARALASAWQAAAESGQGWPTPSSWPCCPGSWNCGIRSPVLLSRSAPASWQYSRRRCAWPSWPGNSTGGSRSPRPRSTRPTSRPSRSGLRCCWRPGVISSTGWAAPTTRPTCRRPPGWCRPTRPAQRGPGCSRPWPTTSITGPVAGMTPSSGRTPKRP